jgi:hypothetical protein
MLGVWTVALAPMSLLLTGMLYLCGYTQRAILLDQFGLGPHLVSEPFQATLARGYPALLVGFLATAALIAIFFVLGWVGNTKTWLAITSKPTSIGGVLKNFYNISLGYLSGSLMGWIVLAPLMLALVSGAIKGDYDASRIYDEVHKSCSSECFIYEADKKLIIGVLVAQDQQLAAIYTQRGMRFIDPRKLTSVRRFAEREISF